MHYLIDGYNLLFRLRSLKDQLKNRRQEVISDLNQKIALVKIDVSIVFDAAFQKGERSRFHFDQLEILFTDEGETADEYILDQVSHLEDARHEIVVTSDQGLVRRIHHLTSAQTMGIEEFMSWLNRAYKNKLRQLKRGELPSSPPAKTALPLKSKPLSAIPSTNAPLEAYHDYYTQIFEAKWEEIQKQEQSTKKKQKKPPRRSKRLPPPPPEPSAETEMERWLKLFERNLSSEDWDQWLIDIFIAYFI